MAKLNEDKRVKVIQVSYLAGTNMPRHIATSDAYLVAEEGSALLIYADERREVKKGGFVMIPANVEHLLKVVEDFRGFIVMREDATINFADEKYSVN